MTILVTGGAGYIGSHTVVEMLAAGYQTLVLDNLSNSKRSVLARVACIAGSEPLFIQADIRDREALDQVFRQHPVEAVIHFAGLKAVGESVAEPLRYYDNNVHGTLVLLETMAAHGVHQLVFSSSATVYGDPQQVPIQESAATGATNPYGRSKLMVEEICADLVRSNPAWRVALLRYFNPVGAHSSGLIGEDPNGLPNNLMPYVAQVAIGKLEKLRVFGHDYATPDGTGVRDYIHVQDLAKGHLAALRYLQQHAGILTVNLGTGQGYSVLDMVRAFEKASARPVPFEFTERRPGDIATCYADPAFAAEKLGWQAELGIDAMCTDAWRWQQWHAENHTKL